MGAWGLHTRRRNGHKSSVGRDKGGEDDEFSVDDEFDCDETAIDRLVDAVADQLHRIAAPGDKSLVTRPPKHTHARMHCAPHLTQRLCLSRATTNDGDLTSLTLQSSNVLTWFDESKTVTLVLLLPPPPLPPHPERRELRVMSCKFRRIGAEESALEAYAYVIIVTCNMRLMISSGSCKSRSIC